MGNTKCLQKGRLFYSAPDSAMVSTRYAPREKKRPSERPVLLSSNLFVSFGHSAMGSTRYDLGTASGCSVVMGCIQSGVQSSGNRSKKIYLEFRMTKN